MADKILVVDDDNELRSELCDFLNGYKVMEASSGEEALKILRRANEIKLVILDVVMPGASGLDILAEIRKMEPCPRTIILTGHSSKDVAIDALKGRADDYIEKPISIKKISSAVERLMNPKYGSGEEDSLSIEDKIEKVKQFVQNNRFKKTTLKEAADAVCLSPKYLSKIFPRYAKTGFTDYRLTVKINSAKELLKKCSHNIDEISYKLGYENTESFIRQFKKITGKTPTEYRKLLSGRRKK